jgi:hypothetical protein
MGEKGNLFILFVKPERRRPSGTPGYIYIYTGGSIKIYFGKKHVKLGIKFFWLETDSIGGLVVHSINLLGSKIGGEFLDGYYLLIVYSLVLS